MNFILNYTDGIWGNICFNNGDETHVIYCYIGNIESGPFKRTRSYECNSKNFRATYLRSYNELRNYIKNGQ